MNKQAVFLSTSASPAFGVMVFLCLGQTVHCRHGELRPAAL